MDLTDEQWEAIRPHVPGPEKKRTTKAGGRPWRDPRDVLNGTLWVLRTGAPWADLPGRYPPYQTCHRRFQRWVELGVFAWLFRFRRLITRFEHKSSNFLGFLRLACVIILLRRL
jgi:transposase